MTLFAEICCVVTYILLTVSVVDYFNVKQKIHIKINVLPCGFSPFSRIISRALRYFGVMSPASDRGAS